MGEKAPDFAAKTLDGQDLKLSDYRGKIVLVDFWATWCGPCVAELPHVREAHKQFGGAGDFVVISVSMDDAEKLVKPFVKKQGMTWPQIVAGPAGKNEIAERFHVEGIPATFLLDAEGKLVAKDLRGQSLVKTVRKHVEMLRAARDKAIDSEDKAAKAPEGGE